MDDIPVKEQQILNIHIPFISESLTLMQNVSIGVGECIGVRLVKWSIWIWETKQNRYCKYKTSNLFPNMLAVADG